MRPLKKIHSRHDESYYDTREEVQYCNNQFSENLLLYWIEQNLSLESPSPSTQQTNSGLFKTFHQYEDLTQLVHSFALPQLHLLIAEQTPDSDLNACLVMESAFTGEWFVFHTLCAPQSSETEAIDSEDAAFHKNEKQPHSTPQNSGWVRDLSSQLILFLNEQSCPVVAWVLESNLYEPFLQGNVLWPSISQSLLPLQSSRFFQTHENALEQMTTQSSGCTLSDLNIINNLSNRSVQALLREIRSDELLIVLSQCQPEILDKFLKNMSARAQEMLTDTLEVSPRVGDDEYRFAENKVLYTLHKMIQSGDISFD